MNLYIPSKFVFEKITVSVSCVALHSVVLLCCLANTAHVVQEQSLQEMLRKAKQHNTTRPKQSFFKEKLAALYFNNVCVHYLFFQPPQNEWPHNLLGSRHLLHVVASDCLTTGGIVTVTECSLEVLEVGTEHRRHYKTKQ